VRQCFALPLLFFGVLCLCFSLFCFSLCREQQRMTPKTPKTPKTKAAEQSTAALQIGNGPAL
jgi:hypothetical protein